MAIKTNFQTILFLVNKKNNTVKLFSNSALSVLKNSFLFLFLSSLHVSAQEFPPKPATLVTDFTQTLSAQEQQALEQKLVAFNDSTSTQIVIVIMKSVGVYEISDYAVKLAEKWGIGQKGKNNGLLILVAKEDRNIDIEVGYGLEPVITDGLSKRIIETVIVPNFKSGNYYAGINEATNILMQVASGEFSAADYVKKNEVRHQSPWFLLLIVLGIFGFVFFTKATAVNKYAKTNNLTFWAAWALMATLASSQRGSWNNFSSGSGRYHGGGGFGGGGSSGFGGFGGGSFGGGGASGSW